MRCVKKAFISAAYLSQQAIIFALTLPFALLAALSMRVILILDWLETKTDLRRWFPDA